ncbi:hypothetical protein OBBRIDRAFT_756313 [Obba rivulosa]|uniref:YDG domain-containing protein n=1 Tax=Obba rivulosa TaxID=1052685 RepID=A0A8E2DK19_9APHY|nr:hypothetical protein OBBRIDRAFT_756313 [Obba rivulosa]
MSTFEPLIQSEAGPSELKREAFSVELCSGRGSPAADQSEATPAKRKQVKKRAQNPKIFGDIPGYPVGSRWRYRQQISDCGVHPGIIAGIYGDKHHGAYSIVLAEGYPDDEDHGYSFIYTGCGGRAKGQRSGPQVEDQSFENSRNAALQVSSMTGNPVRVVRGATSKSDWAPPEGFRYDGLYIVEDTWMEKGKSGHMVCKFRLRRQEGQPPIPRKEGSINVKVPKRRKRKTAEQESTAEGSAGPTKRIKTETAESSTVFPESTQQDNQRLVAPASIGGTPSVNREASEAEQSFFLDLMAQDDEPESVDTHPDSSVEAGTRYDSIFDEDTGRVNTESHRDDTIVTPASERFSSINDVRILEPQPELEDGAPNSQTSVSGFVELEAEQSLSEPSTQGSAIGVSVLADNVHTAECDSDAHRPLRPGRAQDAIPAPIPSDDAASAGIAPSAEDQIDLHIQPSSSVFLCETAEAMPHVHVEDPEPQFSAGPSPTDGEFAGNFNELELMYPDEEADVDIWRARNLDEAL